MVVLYCCMSLAWVLAFNFSLRCLVLPLHGHADWFVTCLMVALCSRSLPLHGGFARRLLVNHLHFVLSVHRQCAFLSAEDLAKLVTMSCWFSTTRLEHLVVWLWLMAVYHIDEVLIRTASWCRWWSLSSFIKFSGICPRPRFARTIVCVGGISCIVRVAHSDIEVVFMTLISFGRPARASRLCIPWASFTASCFTCGTCEQLPVALLFRNFHSERVVRSMCIVCASMLFIFRLSALCGSGWKHTPRLWLHCFSTFSMLSFHCHTVCDVCSAVHNVVGRSALWRPRHVLVLQEICKVKTLKTWAQESCGIVLRIRTFQLSPEEIQGGIW